MKVVLRVLLILLITVYFVNPAFAQGTPNNKIQEEDLDHELETFGPSSEDDEETVPPGGTFQKGPEVPMQGAITGVTDEIYLIVTGDNLWAICSQFLGNPYEWPKLWSYNQYITNPHYIYPGDKIMFTPGSETRVPKMQVAKEEELAMPEDGEGEEVKEEKPIQKKRTALKAEPKKYKLILKNLSFLTKKELKDAGSITHSGEEKGMLSAGDFVYLKFNKGTNVKIGDKFIAFEVFGKIKHPKKGKFLGYQIFKKANIRIVSIDKHVITGLITDSEEPITRGYKVIPYESPIREINPKPMTTDIEGYIIGSEHMHTIIGQNEFAYINLGTNKGVESGSVLYVVRRGDGLKYSSRDKKLPWTVVGKILVVEPKDKTSTVYVLDSTKVLEAGDLVKSKL